MLLLALLACAPDVTCADGSTLGADGLCYEKSSAPPTVDDVLATLPCGEPVTGDGRIDLATGCAAGACVGATYADVSAALGDPGHCDTDASEYAGVTTSQVYCAWDSHVGVYFADSDRDGVADARAVADGIYTFAGFQGTTTDGLGMDAPLGRFLDALGAPDGVSLVRAGADWSVSAAWWTEAGLSWVDGAEPDERASRLLLTGAGGAG
ncbi:MAG: hypothetical protein V4850_04875 [Myxococcota bacterium]